MNATDERAMVTTSPMALAHRSPVELERRLVDVAAERSIIQNFIQKAMVPGEDYGIIPGTKLPSLYKAGAEKLCEMYGYFPKLLEKQETRDEETGHYRVVCVVGLFDRATGQQVAECPGECSTRESKYMYRWVGDRDETIRAMSSEARNSLKTKMAGPPNGRQWQVWRLENDDLHSLWNTVLKMSFKRAFVGATHQGTRSSGIFTLTEKQLDEFIVEGDFRYLDQEDDDSLPGEVPDVQDDTPAAAEPTPAQTPAPRRQAPQRAPAAQRAPSTPPAAEKPTTLGDLDRGGESKATAINMFWVAAKKTERGKDADAVIEASKARFNRGIADLSGQERTDLLAFLERGVWPGEPVTEEEVDPKAAEAIVEVARQQAFDHVADPIFNEAGTMVCGNCNAELDEETGSHK